MRKIRIIGITMILASSLIMACGSQAAYDDKKDSVEGNTQAGMVDDKVTGTDSETEKDDLSGNNSEGEEDASVEVENAGSEMIGEAGSEFAELAKYSYLFASGAGGWGTELYIERDGYFHGDYHDSEMGAIGEGYENGEYYTSVFTGHFTDLKKIDDYTYEMKLADISYKNEVGTSEIIDNMKYIYSTAYGLDGGETFKVYLPGKSVAEIDEEVYDWLFMANGEGDTLHMVALENVNEKTGFFSDERASAKEEATMIYSSNKYTYDFYNEAASECSTTLEMEENAKLRFDVADDCLNGLWTIFKYNSTEEAFQKALEEQRAWNEKKEASAEAARDENEGGSLAPVVYMDTLATMTMDRCLEILNLIS